MSTNKTRTDSQEMLNSLLAEIVKSKGGTINSSDKISLLQSWLTAMGG